MSVKADLHTHTTYSDGAFDPESLIEKAHAAGIAVVSVTDHDSVDALAAAMAAAREKNMKCIPGIEMSAMLENEEIHLLGYFFDYLSAGIQRYTAQSRNARLMRAEKIVAKLNSMNAAITIEDVVRQTKTATSAMITRPHIAQALVERHCVSSYIEAFQRYLGNGCPAYEPMNYLTCAEAVELLHATGGVAVIAHPAVLREQTLLRALRCGADGIETVHPTCTASQTETFRGIASAYFLFETGGSDFHGGARNDASNLGKYWIPAERIETMRFTRRLIFQDR